MTFPCQPPSQLLFPRTPHAPGASQQNSRTGKEHFAKSDVTIASHQQLHTDWQAGLAREAGEPGDETLLDGSRATEFGRVGRNVNRDQFQNGIQSVSHQRSSLQHSGSYLIAGVRHNDFEASKMDLRLLANAKQPGIRMKLEFSLGELWHNSIVRGGS